jgi:hypothetical protein
MNEILFFICVVQIFLSGFYFGCRYIGKKDEK